METQKQEFIVQLVLINEAAKGAYSTERERAYLPYRDTSSYFLDTDPK